MIGKSTWIETGKKQTKKVKLNADAVCVCAVQQTQSAASMQHANAAKNELLSRKIIENQNGV